MAYTPMNFWQNQFSKAADQYGAVASRNLLGGIAKQTGGELVGTPGFLASRSIGPGGLARLRARTLRGGMSKAAGELGGLQTSIAGSKMNFTGNLLSNMQQQEADLRRMKYERDLQKKGGLGGFLGKVAGAGVSTVLSGGNPLAGVRSFLGSSRGPTSQGYSAYGEPLSHYQPKPKVWTPY